jgi:hypothetical protein
VRSIKGHANRADFTYHLQLDWARAPAMIGAITEASAHTAPKTCVHE